MKSGKKGVEVRCIQKIRLTVEFFLDIISYISKIDLANQTRVESSRKRSNKVLGSFDRWKLDIHVRVVISNLVLLGLPANLPPPSVL